MHAQQQHRENLSEPVLKTYDTLGTNFIRVPVCILFTESQQFWLTCLINHRHKVFSVHKEQPFCRTICTFPNAHTNTLELDIQGVSYLASYG